MTRKPPKTNDFMYWLVHCTYKHKSVHRIDCFFRIFDKKIKFARKYHSNEEHAGRNTIFYWILGKRMCIISATIVSKT